MLEWFIGISLALICAALFLLRCHHANQEARESEAAAFKSIAERTADDRNRETNWK